MKNESFNKTIGVISNVLSWITLIGGIILVAYLISDNSETQLILSVSTIAILGFVILQILGNLISLVLALHKKIDSLIIKNVNQNENNKNETFESWKKENPDKTINDFYNEVVSS
jgi:low affinity Fe/Cu permease